MGSAFSCICQSSKEIENEQIFTKAYTSDKSKAANVIQRQYRSNHGYTEFSNKLIEVIEIKCTKESEMAIKVKPIKSKDFDNQIAKQKITKDILDQFSNVLNALVYEGKDNIYQLPPLEFTTESENEAEYYYGGWNIKGQSCGLGTLITKEGRIYKGLFNDDLFNGNGILISSNGDYYLGNWKNGECNGFGKLHQTSVNVKYEGEFRANEKCGEGYENYADGTYYHGNFANNEKEGQGKLVFADNSYYEGNFSQSLYEGNGVYYWADGRIYKGEFKKGQMEGNAIHKWSNGSRYSGHYSNNKKHGHGVYLWQIGKELVGNWMNNEPHGNCIYFNTGKKHEVVFRFGKIISSRLISEGSTALPSPIENPQIEDLEFNKESAMNNVVGIQKKRIESLVNKEIASSPLYLCQLCKDLLDEPYQCLTCKNNYCRNCILNKKDNTFKQCINNQCKDPQYEVNASLSQSLNELEMKCSCGEVIDYGNRNNHKH